MGYQSVVNVTVKEFANEALKRYIKSGLDDISNSIAKGVQCSYAHKGDGWHCTRRSGHKGIHIATSGKKSFLVAWWGDDIKVEEHNAIGLLTDLVEFAAAAENVAIVTDLVESINNQCPEENVAGRRRCTRPAGHKGAHIVLRDQGALLEFWVEDC